MYMLKNVFVKMLVNSLLLLMEHYCFFNCALEYAITRVQENQVRLKLNGTHQLLAYGDYVNLLGDNVDTIDKNKDSLIDASKKVGLEINVEKTKYMLLSHHQNAGPDYISKSNGIKHVFVVLSSWKKCYEFCRVLQNGVQSCKAEKSVQRVVKAVADP
jgi:hypothetical protein